MSILPVTCTISLPAGVLSVNEGIYRLSSTALENETVAWRRSDVNNPFVEGTWTINALRENVMGQLDIWVRGESSAETTAGIAAVKAALAQRNYAIAMTFDGIQRTYLCYVADLVVRTTREFRFARMAQVSAQVPRHPTFTEVVL